MALAKKKELEYDDIEGDLVSDEENPDPRDVFGGDDDAAAQNLDDDYDDEENEDEDHDDDSDEDSEDAVDDDDDEEDGDDDPEDRVTPAKRPAASKSGRRTQDQPEPQAPAEDDDPLAGVDLDEGVEPSIKTAMTKLGGVVKDLRKQLKAKDAEAESERIQRTIRQFDKLVVNSDQSDLFGEGPAEKLDRKSDHFKNREKLLNAVGRVVAGYRATGQDPPPLEEAFAEAFASTFRRTGQSRKEQNKTNPVVAEVRKVRRGQRINVPKGGSNRPSLKEAEADAKGFIRDFFKRSKG